MYDIAGSAHFYNKADFGLCVHRNKFDNGTEAPVSIQIQKVRFKQHGKKGEILMDYSLYNGSYNVSQIQDLEKTTEGFF